jgi:hypothetical protein
MGFQRLSLPRPSKLLLNARGKVRSQATNRRLNLPRQEWPAKLEKGAKRGQAANPYHD